MNRRMIDPAAGGRDPLATAWKICSLSCPCTARCTRARPTISRTRSLSPWCVRDQPGPADRSKHLGPQRFRGRWCTPSRRPWCGVRGTAAETRLPSPFRRPDDRVVADVDVIQKLFAKLDRTVDLLDPVDGDPRMAKRHQEHRQSIVFCCVPVGPGQAQSVVGGETPRWSTSWRR